PFIFGAVHWTRNRITVLSAALIRPSGEPTNAVHQTPAAGAAGEPCACGRGTDVAGHSRRRAGRLRPGLGGIPGSARALRSLGAASALGRDLGARRLAARLAALSIRPLGLH